MKNKFNFIALLVMVVISIAPHSVFGQNTAGNPSVVLQEVDHITAISIDRGKDYLRGWPDLASIITTYVSNDGTVSVCSATTTVTQVYEYSSDLRHIRTMRFQNEFQKFGAFTKDNEGNFYFFYAKDVEEDDKNIENMALVKYDSSGRRLNMYRLIANAQNSFNGIRRPFRSGSCRMEISGNMLAIYFATEMFMSQNDGLNHQASYGFIVDKNTFLRIDRGQANRSLQGVPYASHTFNQFILPVQDGFIFADQGDMYPRQFFFNRFKLDQRTVSLSAFRFKEGSRYQFTFAQMGGLAETSGGYIFAGTYERNNVVLHESHNDSRNLFILTMDNELNAVSQPVWITNYNNKNTQNAGNPKITRLNANRYLLMWELMSNENYISTYCAIIDERGRVLQAAREMRGVRLNINDTLRYCQTTGNVYWATNGPDMKIAVYSYNADRPFAFSGMSGIGYLLVPTVLTANKTTVTQNELFAVSTTPRNAGYENFPGGQVGVALVDNNDRIVEVMGVANRNALNAGSTGAALTINCYAPETVRAGQYRLMAAARPEGGQWRVVTLALPDVSNSINFTVTAGEANGGGYGMALTSFAANNTTVSGNAQVAVSYRFLNAGSDIFNGQIGAALTDNNNNIVTVLRSWNSGRFVVGARNNDPISVTCTVPNSVVPGQYKLRMVLRPNANAQWKIATLSLENSPTGFDLTVTRSGAAASQLVIQQPAAQQPTAQQPAAQQTLSANALTTVIINNGQRMQLNFTAPSAGVFVFESSNNGSLDPVAFSAAVGTTSAVIINDDGGEGRNFQFSRNLSAGEVFTFFAGVHGDRGSGSYTINIQAVQSVTLSANALTTVTINNGQRIQLNFTAPAAGDYRFESSNNGSLDPTAYSASTGTGSAVVISQDDGNGKNFLFIRTLRAGEVFTFFAGIRSGTGNGSYTVNVQRVQAVLLSLNIPATVTINNGQRVQLNFTAPSAGVYTFESTNNGSLDPLAYTAVSGSREIDDDSGQGENFLFTRNLRAGETFTFFAGVIWDRGSGSYTVNVQSGR